jgi:uncharacterized spore protein YtfJ
MVDENLIKTTVEELKGLIKVNNFVGEHIETEDKILIPFAKCGLGFGVGQGKATENEEGFGSGAAAGIEPISIVVIDKKVDGVEGVRVLNLTKGTEVSKAISELGIVVSDLVKEIVSNSNQNKANTSENTSEDASEDSKTSNNS